MMNLALSTLVQSARVSRAPAWRVVLACLLDVSLVVAGVGVVVALVRTSHESAAIVAGWVTLAFVVWQCVAFTRTGQTVAWRLLRLRLTSLGGYPGVGIVKTRGTVFAVADLMSGADPLLPISEISGAREQYRAGDRRSQVGSSTGRRAKRTRVTAETQRGRSLPSHGRDDPERLEQPPATETQGLRRTRAAVPVTGAPANGTSVSVDVGLGVGDAHTRRVAPRRAAAPHGLDAHTRVQAGAAGWAPPRGVSPDSEPLAEETIFAAQQTPRWSVLLDGSDIGPLTQSMVFGRNPEPVDGARAVTVMDLTREVSQQHLRLTLTDEGSVEVEDLGSTNGSTLLSADGIGHALTPGEQRRLTQHDAVQFSGHTLTITRKGADHA